MAIGELIVDVYLKGCCSRIAPEASVPLIDLLSRTACLGGAGNVAANLNAKRSKVLFCRVVGEDEGVHIAKEMLRSQEISDQLVVIDSGSKTLIKTRVSLTSQTMVRFDEGTVNRIGSSTETALISQQKTHKHNVMQS